MDFGEIIQNIQFRGSELLHDVSRLCVEYVE